MGRITDDVDLSQGYERGFEQIMHRREERMGRHKLRELEPATLSFRLKPYKAAMQLLRPITRSLKDNTTVSFMPTPCMVIQSVRNQFMFKIVVNNNCMYVTSRTQFGMKTINNTVPLLGNFAQMSGNKELTRFYVQDTSELSTRICMSAPDFAMDCSAACVHRQDVVRESGTVVARLELEYQVVTEVVKWVLPHTRPKRNTKKTIVQNPLVQIVIVANPATVKFVLMGCSELEFTSNNRVIFQDIRNLKFTLQARNLYQAFGNCLVTKNACTLKVFSNHDMLLHLSSQTPYFTVENFLTEETVYHRHQSSLAGAMAGAVATREDDEDGDEPDLPGNSGAAPEYNHARGGSSADGCCPSGAHKGGLGSLGIRPKDDACHGHRHDPHKITSYLTGKEELGGTKRGPEKHTEMSTRKELDKSVSMYYDNKEDSDSEDSGNYDFMPLKKQKCN